MRTACVAAIERLSMVATQAQQVHCKSPGQQRKEWEMNSHGDVRPLH